MNNSNHAGEPSNTTAGDTGNTQGGVTYDLGFAFVVILFILILCYTTYKYKYKKGSQSSSPPPRTTTFRTTTNQDSDTDDSNSLTHSNGLNDDILSTLPTLLYSEAVKPRPHKVDMGSGCSICLVDYKPTDVLRLLPECGHLFHVICVDTWLKVHSTCPVCRKSALSTELT